MTAIGAEGMLRAMAAMDRQILELRRNGRVIGRLEDGCPIVTSTCDDVPAFWSALRYCRQLGRVPLAGRALPVPRRNLIPLVVR